MGAVLKTRFAHLFSRRCARTHAHAQQLAALPPERPATAQIGGRSPTDLRPDRYLNRAGRC